MRREEKVSSIIKMKIILKNLPGITCVDPDRIRITDPDPQISGILIQFGSGSTTLGVSTSAGYRGCAEQVSYG